MIIETLSAHGVEALIEAHPPVAQGASIIKAHVVEVVEVETLVHVCDQLIARDEAERRAGRSGFTALQRLLVTNTRNQARAIVERGRLDADERGWLMRSAQLLLATVL